MATNHTFEYFALLVQKLSIARMEDGVICDRSRDIEALEQLISEHYAHVESVAGIARTVQCKLWMAYRTIESAGPLAAKVANGINKEEIVQDILNVKSSSMPGILSPSVRDESYSNKIAEERARIRSDPYYAMEQYQTVETVVVGDEGRKRIPFVPNEYQMRAYARFLRKLVSRIVRPALPWMMLLMKPRQVGSTEHGKQMLVYFANNYESMHYFLMFPREDDAKKHFADVLHQCDTMAANWPELFPGVQKREFPKVVLNNKSSITVLSAQSTISGLGENFNGGILSEAGKYEKIREDVWTDVTVKLIPAIHAQPMNFLIIETTNDEVAREVRRIAKACERGDDTYEFVFFSWTVVKEYVGAPVRKPESATGGQWDDFDIVDGTRVPVSEMAYCDRHALTPEQIGFRRAKIGALRGKVELFHQEYPVSYEESCVNSTSKFFPPVILSRTYPKPIARLSLSTANKSWPSTVQSIILDVREHDGGEVYVWDLPTRTDKYVVGCDFSNGIPGGDWSVFVVLRVSDGKQVAGVRMMGTPKELALMLAMLCKFFGDGTYVNGELNDVGKAVRSHWVDFNYPYNYTRLLERKSFDVHSDSMWFLQHVGSRGPMLLRLREDLISRDTVPMDERFMFDAFDFEASGNGRYEAADGTSVFTGEKIRDDYVFAYGLANEMRRTHPATERREAVAFGAEQAKMRMRDSVQSASVSETTTYGQMLKSLGINIGV